MMSEHQQRPSVLFEDESETERLLRRVNFDIPSTTFNESHVTYHIQISLGMSPAAIISAGTNLNLLPTSRPATTWVVLRRFSDFKALQILLARASALSENAMRGHFPLPDSGMLSAIRRKSPRLVATRCSELVGWLEDIFQQPLFRSSPPLRAFLTDGCEPVNATETGSATAAAKWAAALMAVDGGEDIFSAAAGYSYDGKPPAEGALGGDGGSASYPWNTSALSGGGDAPTRPSYSFFSSGQASPSLGFGRNNKRASLLSCAVPNMAASCVALPPPAPPLTPAYSNFIANSGSPSSSVSSSLLRESSALDISNASGDGGASYHSFASSAQDQRIDQRMSQHHHQQRPHQQHGITGPGKPGETLEDIIRDEGSSSIAKYARMLSVGMTLSSVEAKMERNGTHSPGDIARLSRALEESSKDAIEALREVASASSPRPADSRTSATSPSSTSSTSPAAAPPVATQSIATPGDAAGGEPKGKPTPPPSESASSGVVVSSSSSSVRDSWVGNTRTSEAQRLSALRRTQALHAKSNEAMGESGDNEGLEEDYGDQNDSDVRHSFVTASAAVPPFQRMSETAIAEQRRVKKNVEIAKETVTSNGGSAVATRRAVVPPGPVTDDTPSNSRTDKDVKGTDAASAAPSSGTKAKRGSVLIDGKVGTRAPKMKAKEAQFRDAIGGGSTRKDDETPPVMAKGTVADLVEPLTQFVVPATLELPAEGSAGTVTLCSMGCGVRIKKVPIVGSVKIYVLGVFVESAKAWSQLAAFRGKSLEGNAAFFDTFLSVERASFFRRALHMTFVRSVKAAQVANALSEKIKAHVSPQLFALFRDAMITGIGQGGINKGETLVFFWEAPTTLRVFIRGKLCADLEGETLPYFLHKGFLGENSGVPEARTTVAAGLERIFQSLPSGSERTNSDAKQEDEDSIPSSPDASSDEGSGDSDEDGDIRQALSVVAEEPEGALISEEAKAAAAAVADAKAGAEVKKSATRDAEEEQGAKAAEGVDVEDERQKREMQEVEGWEKAEREEEERRSPTTDIANDVTAKTSGANLPAPIKSSATLPTADQNLEGEADDTEEEEGDEYDDLRSGMSVSIQNNASHRILAEAAEAVEAAAQEETSDFSDDEEEDDLRNGMSVALRYSEDNDVLHDAADAAAEAALAEVEAANEDKDSVGSTGKKKKRLTTKAVGNFLGLRAKGKKGDGDISGDAESDLSEEDTVNGSKKKSTWKSIKRSISRGSSKDRLK